MKKKSTLQKKIAGYSLLAGVMVASQSDAQVIYTNLQPDVDVGSVAPSTFPFNDNYDLDLNNDGVFDFDIHLLIKGYNPATSSGPSDRGFKFDEAIYPVGNSNQMAYTYGGSLSRFAAVFAPGQVVGPTLPGTAQWGDQAVLSYQVGYYGGGISQDKDVFAGLRFKLGGNYHYGWVRLAINTNPGNNPPLLNIIVRDYAYNASPNVPITAGDTGGAGCLDLNESNNSILEATSLGASPNTTTNGLIDPAGDQDFYSFTVQSGAPNVRVSLTNLPKNYDLWLLKSNGNKIGKSKNGGKADEQIVSNGLAPGTYYAKVFQKGLQFQDKKCYTLQVETSAVPFKLDETAAPSLASGLKVFPNPFNGSTTMEFSLTEKTAVDVSLFDLQGRKLQTVATGNFDSGNHQVHVNAEGLLPGMYFLVMKTPSSQQVQKISVVK